MSSLKLDKFFQLLIDELYGFLLEEADFVGPEREPGSASYFTTGLSVWIFIDPREGTLGTVVRGMVGERYCRAGLSCLYVQAGLGPAQHLHHTARTGHSLRKALESQSLALRKVLPLMHGEERDRLLTACHAR